MALPVTFVAGDVLEAAQLNSNFTYLEGAGGLTKIAGTTTFSAVSSFTLPAGTFTSAYKNYLLLIELVASGVGANLSLQVRSGSTTATTTYYGSVNRLLFTGGTSNLLSNNASSLTVTTSAAPKINIQLNLGGGFGQTGTSNITGFSVSDNGNGSATIGGTHAVSQNNDSLVFSVASGTITGNYEVYGYAL